MKAFLRLCWGKPMKNKAFKVTLPHLTITLPAYNRCSLFSTELPHIYSIPPMVPKNMFPKQTLTKRPAVLTSWPFLYNQVQTFPYTQEGFKRGQKQIVRCFYPLQNNLVLRPLFWTSREAHLSKKEPFLVPYLLFKKIGSPKMNCPPPPGYGPHVGKQYR